MLQLKVNNLAYLITARADNIIEYINRATTNPISFSQYTDDFYLFVVACLHSTQDEISAVRRAYPSGSISLVPSIAQRIELAKDAIQSVPSSGTQQELGLYAEVHHLDELFTSLVNSYNELIFKYHPDPSPTLT